MRLVESASQIREGLIVPVTEADEVVSEANTGVSHLHALHQDTQARYVVWARTHLHAAQVNCHDTRSHTPQTGSRRPHRPKRHRTVGNGDRQGPARRAAARVAVPRRRHVCRVPHRHHRRVRHALCPQHDAPAAGRAHRAGARHGRTPGFVLLLVGRQHEAVCERRLPRGSGRPVVWHEQHGWPQPGPPRFRGPDTHPSPGNGVSNTRRDGHCGCGAACSRPFCCARPHRLSSMFDSPGATGTPTATGSGSFAAVGGVRLKALFRCAC